MKRLILALLIILAWPLSAFAATLNFSWSANTESDLAGYRLYTKNVQTGAFTQIGGNIAKTLTAASVTCPDVVGSDQYNFVMTAFDGAGNESGKSLPATKDGAVYVLGDTTAPAPPMSVHVLQQLVDALERIAVALESR